MCQILNAKLYFIWEKWHLLILLLANTRRIQNVIDEKILTISWEEYILFLGSA